MTLRSTRILRWGLLPILVGLALAGVAACAIYALSPTTLRVAVAPRDGTEPELLAALAARLASERTDMRLQLTVMDDVRDSAAALENGEADVAVVRPDVAMPVNGLTVVLLRDQAMIIASPGKGGVTSFPRLSGKRLGIVAHRDSDSALLAMLLQAYRLTLRPAAAGKPPASEVWWTPLNEDEVTAALKAGTIDAVLAVIAPTAPRAMDIVDHVAAASSSGQVAFVTVDDQDALTQRFPLLQDVTIPAGLFSGRPNIPADEVKTLGSSYRLMARVSLGRTTVSTLARHIFEMRPALARSTPAAYYVAAPAYDTTAAATSARLPNHPGAIDYYEREQHGFIDRYSDTLYLLALVASGFGSAIAWTRQRLARLRKERIEEITDRLLEISVALKDDSPPAERRALEAEAEMLTLDAARHARAHEPAQKSVMALALAIYTVNRQLTRPARSEPPSSKP